MSYTFQEAPLTPAEPLADWDTVLAELATMAVTQDYMDGMIAWKESIDRRPSRGSTMNMGDGTENGTVHVWRYIP